MSIRERFYNFIYHYQVPVCVGFGMIGFFLSVLIFTAKNGEIRNGIQDTPYGEIVISNKKSLVLELLTKRKQSLDSIARGIEITLSPLLKDATQTEEEKFLQKKLASLKSALKNVANEYSTLEIGHSDSLTTYSKYIYPKSQEFLDSINSEHWISQASQVKKVYATLQDTCSLIQPKLKYTVQLDLKQNKRAVLMDFITDYPQFGLWLVLAIAQMSLWFLLFPLLTGNLLDLKRKIGSYYRITLPTIALNCILPSLFIGGFYLLFITNLADSYVIPDGYFFTNYNFRIQIYAVFGYGLAIFCFGTYLTLARQLILMDAKAAEENKVRSSNITLNENYKSLLKAFNNSFLASAIILSFFVLWAGITINAVNSTEAIRFHGIITGQPLIPNDFVYLLGLLHTCILLIFYIPMKLKFDSLPISHGPGIHSDGTSHSRTIVKALGTSLGSILVTTSPLIAGLIQKLLNMLVEN